MSRPARAVVLCLVAVGAAACGEPPRGARTDAAAPDAIPRRPLLADLDFEDGTLKGWSRLKLPTPDAASVVEHPVRTGRRALRIRLRRSDEIVSKGRRAELELADVARLGQAYWYGLSIFVPADWPRDFKDEVVAQWNATADTEEGEDEKRSPPLAIRIQRDRWRITQRWDDRRITPPWNSGHKRELWSGRLTRGVWTDWVLHARWSYRDDGRITLWRNHEPVVRHRGPNCYNDSRGLRFKIGVYKPQWNSAASESAVTERSIFHDAIRVGDASATYDDVAVDRFSQD